MRPASERRRYIVASSLIGWAHTSSSVYAPSQWETTLHCNVASHWLSAYAKYMVISVPADVSALQAARVSCDTGPCITTATRHCHKNFSQWKRNFHWKLCCHLLKVLRQRQIAVVIQGPVLTTQRNASFFVVKVSLHMWSKLYHMQASLII